MPNRDIQVGRFDQLVHELELTLALMREGLVGKFIPDGVTFGSPQEVLGRPASSAVSMWPPPLAPAILEAADRPVFVDVWAATQRARSPAGAITCPACRQALSTTQAPSPGARWYRRPIVARAPVFLVPLNSADADHRSSPGQRRGNSIRGRVDSGRAAGYGLSGSGVAAGRAARGRAGADARVRARAGHSDVPAAVRAACSAAERDGVAGDGLVAGDSTVGAPPLSFSSAASATWRRRWARSSFLTRFRSCWAALASWLSSRRTCLRTPGGIFSAAFGATPLVASTGETWADALDLFLPLPESLERPLAISNPFRGGAAGRRAPLPGARRQWPKHIAAVAGGHGVTLQSPQ